MTRLFYAFMLSSFICFLSFTKPNYQYTLIVFEGSDWCVSCRKFDKEILKNSTVIAYLKEKAIEIKRIDFPQRKKMSEEQEKINKEYAEKYGFQGVFPTVVFASLKPKDYHTLLNSAKITPEYFLKWLESKIQKDK